MLSAAHENGPYESWLFTNREGKKGHDPAFNNTVIIGSDNERVNTSGFSGVIE